MKAIKYIGKHKEHKENIYGTGVMFIKGVDEVKLFDDDIANKMVKLHPDTYMIDDSAPFENIAIAKKPEDETEEDALRNDLIQVRTEVQRMSKTDLSALAFAKYQHQFPEGTPVKEMRSYLTNLLSANIGG